MINGALYTLSGTLADPSLVIAWFLANLSASNFLIGLIVPLRDVGWSLPQLFISSSLSRQAYKMPLYNQMAVVRAAAWIGITIAIFVVRTPGVLIASFVALYTLYSLAAGAAGLPFMDITAKTIPPRQRGRYFGERLFWGGILGVGGSFLVKLALDGQLGLTFPANVGLLMLLTTLVSTVALATYSNTIEPPDHVPAETTNLWRHLQLAFQLPYHDYNFRLYLIARIVLIIGGIAIPFLAIYATRTLEASGGMIGIYLGTRTVASLASNRLWSRLVDHYSGQLVMQSSAIQGLAAMLIALAVTPLTRALALPLGSGAWLFTLVFILTGSSTAAIGVAGSSLMLNLAPDNRRSMYVGFANTVLGFAMLFTALGGLVADLTGYEGVFLLAALCNGLSIIAIAQIKDAPIGANA